MKPCQREEHCRDCQFMSDWDAGIRPASPWTLCPRLKRTVNEVLACGEVPPRHLAAWPLNAAPAAAAMKQARPDVILAGPVGTGKTSTAVAILATLFTDRYPAMALPRYRANQVYRGLFFVTVPKLLTARLTLAQDTDARRYYSAASERRYVVVDDLGSEAPTDWTRSILEEVICQRHDWALPTIVTTNLTLAEIHSRYGERVASRWSATAHEFFLTGADRRRAVP